MNISSPKKIVLLGMLTKFPVAGAIWGTVQYLIGFQRLGYDVYYVEAHGITPTKLMVRPEDDSSLLAAQFIDRVMRRFDFGDKWCFQALHDDGRCYGMTELQLKELYRSADLIINFHAGTVPRPEHAETGRLICLETDPVALEIELFDRKPEAIDFVRPHKAFFTWGLNYGQPDCRVPLPPDIRFVRSCPVIVPDLWQPHTNGAGQIFTTIGNWRQPGVVHYQGDSYTWSKHHEYLKFIDLPRRTSQPFELALSQFDDSDRQLLESNGWHVRRSLDFSLDLDSYRSYVMNSRGEFTVAKDQNVRLKSGWFSERSAQYLASGRPVITQDTGFGSYLPTGKGLFAFNTMDDILAAVDSINSNYKAHCRAAKDLTQDCFNYDVVLRRLLTDVGLSA